MRDLNVNEIEAVSGAGLLTGLLSGGARTVFSLGKTVYNTVEPIADPLVDGLASTGSSLIRTGGNLIDDLI